MLRSAGAATKAERQGEGKFHQSMIKEGFSPLDADCHSRAVDFSQDIPGQVVVKIPQAELFTVFARVNIAIRTRRTSIPSEQTPEFLVGPDGQSLIEHLAYAACLEAVANLGERHRHAMSQAVIDSCRPPLCREQSVDAFHRQRLERGHCSG